MIKKITKGILIASSVILIALTCLVGCVGKKTSKEVNENVIVDNEYCKFTVTGVDPDAYGAYNIKVKCENRTNSTMMFLWGDVFVNGVYTSDTVHADFVQPNKISNTVASLLSSELEDNDIEEVEDVEFKLKVYDMSSDDGRITPFIDEWCTICLSK